MAAPNPSTAELSTTLKQVELKRHYVPRSPFRVVGHTRPRIVAKDAAGNEHVRQEEAFIEGEMFPPVQPGVGFGPVLDKDGNIVRQGKVWAGTVIEVPLSEAQDMRKAKIGEYFN